VASEAAARLGKRFRGLGIGGMGVCGKRERGRGGEKRDDEFNAESPEWRRGLSKNAHSSSVLAE
jgi:hypothetical protein